MVCRPLGELSRRLSINTGVDRRLLRGAAQYDYVFDVMLIPVLVRVNRFKIAKRQVTRHRVRVQLYWRLYLYQHTTVLFIVATHGGYFSVSNFIFRHALYINT